MVPRNATRRGVQCTERVRRRKYPNHDIGGEGHSLVLTNTVDEGPGQRKGSAFRHSGRNSGRFDQVRSSAASENPSARLSRSVPGLSVGVRREVRNPILSRLDRYLRIRVKGINQQILSFLRPNPGSIEETRALSLRVWSSLVSSSRPRLPLTLWRNGMVAKPVTRIQTLPYVIPLTTFFEPFHLTHPTPIRPQSRTRQRDPPLAFSRTSLLFATFSAFPPCENSCFTDVLPPTKKHHPTSLYPYIYHRTPFDTDTSDLDFIESLYSVVP